MTSPMTSPMTSRMTSPRIKIGIPGAAGRMGRMLIREIDAAPDLQLVAATDRPGSEAIGPDSGFLAGTGTNGVMIADTPQALAAADVIIDFTSPAASVAHAGIAGTGGSALVVPERGILSGTARITFKSCSATPSILKRTAT